MSTRCETNYSNVTTPLILHTNVKSKCISNLKNKSPLIIILIFILLCCIMLYLTLNDSNNNNTFSLYPTTTSINDQSHILSQPHYSTKTTTITPNDTISDDNRVVVVMPGKGKKKGKENKGSNGGKGSKGGKKTKSKSTETTTTIKPTFVPSLHRTSSPLPTATTKRSAKSSQISSTHTPSPIATRRKMSTSKPTYLTTTRKPTKKPTKFPSKMPTQKPTKFPTYSPTFKPTKKQPTHRPTHNPTPKPSEHPSHVPTMKPTKHKIPKMLPSNHHNNHDKMTKIPTVKPTTTHTARPTARPTVKPTHLTTQKPTKRPTQKPSHSHTAHPTQSLKTTWHKPSHPPTKRPSHSPTKRPSHSPIIRSTHSPKSIDTTSLTTSSSTMKPSHSSSKKGENKPSQAPVSNSNATTWRYMIDVEIKDVADHLDVNEDEIANKIKLLIDNLDLNNNYILRVNVDKMARFYSMSMYTMQTTEAQSFNIGIFIYTLNEFDMQIITKYVQSDEFKQQLKDLLHQSNDGMMTVGVGVSDIEPNGVQHSLMYYVLPSIISMLICIAICCGAYRCFGRDDEREDDMLLIDDKESMHGKASYQQIIPKIRAVDVPSLSGIDFDSNLMRTPPECRGNLEYVD